MYEWLLLQECADLCVTCLGYLQAKLKTCSVCVRRFSENNCIGINYSENGFRYFVSQNCIMQNKLNVIVAKHLVFEY